MTNFSKKIHKSKKKSVVKKHHISEKTKIERKTIKYKNLNIKFDEYDLKKIVKFYEISNDTIDSHADLLRMFDKNSIIEEELPYTHDNITLTKIDNIQDIIDPVKNILKIMFKHQAPVQYTPLSFNFVNSAERINISRYIFTRNDGMRYIFIKVVKKANINNIYLFFVHL
jgi:hypothetical protein